MLKAPTFLVLITMFLSSVVPAFATAPELNDAAPKPIKLTSEELSKRLIEGNEDLFHTINKVNMARDNVGLARGELLPSINLGMVVSMGNPVLFLMNSVGCLVPFIFPSRWFDLRSSRKSYKAEVVGLHLMKLNLFATAYALTRRIQDDQASYMLSEAQYARYEDYVKELRRMHDAKLISDSDLMSAEDDLDGRKLSLSSMRQLMTDEVATLRKSLGFDLNQKIEFALSDLSPSSLEDDVPANALAGVYAIAPEREQLTDMKEAAKASLRSAQWSFIAGCSGSQGNLSSQRAGSQFNFSTGTSIGLGFGYISHVKLARRNYKEVELRETDLSLELARILETTIEATAETKLRMATSQNMLVKEQSLLVDAKHKYQLGYITFQQVLAQNDKVDRREMDILTAKSELEGHRITLKRVAMEDAFAKIYSDSKKKLESE